MGGMGLKSNAVSSPWNNCRCKEKEALLGLESLNHANYTAVLTPRRLSTLSKCA